MNDASRSLRFETGAATHCGAVRDHNEDAFVAIPASGIWAVADGMGGHEAGDVASGIIVQEVASVGRPVSALDQRARFSQRLTRANQRIMDYARQRRLVTVGSTLVALLIHDQELACTWAGDSRLYLLRKNVLTRMTRDHSEVERLIASGRISEVEARLSPARNIITRAIGIHSRPDPETVTGLAEPGDLFLLCSDGLTEHLDDGELQAALAQDLPCQQIADALIGQTLARGARDNVTALVLRCHAMPEVPEE